jgi:hypothetical protein
VGKNKCGLGDEDENENARGEVCRGGKKNPFIFEIF